MKKKDEYYKQFSYRIIKKFSVLDRKEIKDYSKKSIYFYIIQENIDSNKFLFISNKHYEEKTLINAEQFELIRIKDHEEFNIIFKKNKFKEKYIKNCSPTTENRIEINLRNITFNKNTEKNIEEKGLEPYFSKEKIHTKKIAIDNPNFAIAYLKSLEIKSFIKKFEKNLYCKNEYNPLIKENFISTLFSLRNKKYMLFNDHTIHLDQGKTGKSSIITHLSSKSDNISIAGLYGSSDGKNAKFTGGLITTTDSSICIDELNELAENTKNDKILSILNTFLENGEYNYNKQFRGKVTGGNQFIFLGNITQTFNFSNLMLNLMGNPLTFGRRIGIIVYNSKLNGFKSGNIITEPNTFILSVQKFITQIFNYILYETKFYEKLINHNLYYTLKEDYKKKCKKLSLETEDETLKNFILSHSEDIKRQVCRALKLYIYENLDLYLIQDKSYYENKLIYKLLIKTKLILENNLFNLKNIISDVNSSDLDEINSKKQSKEYNQLYNVEKFSIQLLWENQENISVKGINYDDLVGDKKYVKQSYSDYRLGKRKHLNLQRILKTYGINMIITTNKEIMFYLYNENLFITKCSLIFTDFETKIDLLQNEPKTEPKQENIEVETINFDDDLN